MDLRRENQESRDQINASNLKSFDDKNLSDINPGVDELAAHSHLKRISFSIQSRQIEKDSGPGIRRNPDWSTS